MKLYRFLITVFMGSIFLTGCADIAPPGAGQILKNPLGSRTVKIGMTKSQVLTVYSEPDIKDTVESDEWSGTREEWYYRARYSALPVNAGYLSEDVYLYFDGESLTNISEKPIGRKEKKDSGSGPAGVNIK